MKIVKQQLFEADSKAPWHPESKCICSFQHNATGRKGRGQEMMAPLGAGHYCFATVNR